jgi:hypothetical protein
MGCCENLPFIGSGRGDDILAKIKTLVNTDAPDNATASDVVEKLYGILDIMDSKASGLLTLNSFFIALVTTFLGLATSPDNNPIKAALPNYFVPLAEFDLTLLAVSSIICLFVVRVTWRFLGHVTFDPVARKYDFGIELRRLAIVVDDRTRYYWIAWWGTFAAFALPLVIWIPTLLGRLF